MNRSRPLPPPALAREEGAAYHVLFSNHSVFSPRSDIASKHPSSVQPSSSLPSLHSQQQSEQILSACF
ncbi:unnamed protein product [Nezara viridula]|uniref:Uncharacterized protein n=1 Tax=Nezara viridula TaxID=85310 RepID=A0A9P0HBF2_NEZVI|nr:unnamed protein product [Nezara viridula]